MRRGPLALGPGGEFDRLRAIFASLGSLAPELGDDCAVVRMGDTNLVVSVDLSLEGVHFRTEWLEFTGIGARAAAAALSDLAADGAKPLGVLVSLGLPPAATDEIAAKIMTGVAVKGAFDAPVLGGDLVRSDKYLVDVCVLGTADRPIRRWGATPGDGVWVTGRLGGAGLALQALLNGGRAADPFVARRYDDPEPRLSAGMWLAAHGATAIDRKSTRLNSSHGYISYAVFCLKKKKKKKNHTSLL